MPNVAEDTRVVNVIKGLVLDATRKADSGHPGGPMSSADAACVLFREFLRFDPADPRWPNRDRFVLSAGHESMLLYALLHLNGWLDLEDLRNFRQFGSRTPGHPEYDITPGVEATTGPLGQGLAMAVGMAVAEAHLAARLGDVVNHRTYVLASDGDLQEPVALGAAALAGHWGLSRLVVLYDSNMVQLAGPTDRADSTDHRKLFEAFGWKVLDIDGHDHDQIRFALGEAGNGSERPTLIICRTVMAKGATESEGDFNAHGSPLSAGEIAATKRNLGLPEDEHFFVPPEAVDRFRSRHAELAEAARDWRKTLERRQAADPAFAALWEQSLTPVPASFAWPEFEPGQKIASRKVWGRSLMTLKEQAPFFVGGSADLDPSNMTAEFRDTAGVFGRDDHSGRSLSFGVREFPMCAVVNGMMLHGGVRAFGATFLTFSDYARNALRMAALQKLPSLFVFTHDSFHLGEDGPTHQPVEHASSLRLIPGMWVLRPADAHETLACLELALSRDDGPCSLLLTRQGLPTIDPAAYPGLTEGPRHGGYVLRDSDGIPEIVLLATGSEVSLVLEAAERLTGLRVRVVSLPCLERFEAQPEAYRKEVLGPEDALRVAVEAGSTAPWWKYVGAGGMVVGRDEYGHSAPAGVLAIEYGFTPDKLAERIRKHLAS